MLSAPLQALRGYWEAVFGRPDRGGVSSRGMRRPAWVLMGALIATSAALCHSQDAVVVTRPDGGGVRLRRSGSLEGTGCAVLLDRSGRSQTVMFPAGSDSVSIAVSDGGGLTVRGCVTGGLRPAEATSDAVDRAPNRRGRPRSSEPPSLEWRNRGGDSARSGLSGTTAPVSERVLWSRSLVSDYAHLPVVEGDRVFLDRRLGSNQVTPVYALDLSSGTERWHVELPFNAGDWFTWVAGVRGGTVYATRAGNGNTVQAPVYALDGDTGAIVWASQARVDAEGSDGVVFAPDGDLVVGSYRSLTRINADDGSTAWSVPRQCCISGSCGAAVVGGTVYTVEIGDQGGLCGGGPRLAAFDLETGALRYKSPRMPGAGAQNVPFADADGGVYFSSTGGSPGFRHLYAWTDTGSGFTERWHVPAAWVSSSSHAVGPDGSLYILGPGYDLQRLDPADGSVVAAAGVGSDSIWVPMMAVDRRGSVYFNGAADHSRGHLWAFSAGLEPLWDVAVYGIAYGGPALAAPGVLLVAPTSGVVAYQADVIFEDGFESRDIGAWTRRGSCGSGACPPPRRSAGTVAGSGSVRAPGASPQRRPWTSSVGP